MQSEKIHCKWNQMSPFSTWILNENLLFHCLLHIFAIVSKQADNTQPANYNALFAMFFFFFSFFFVPSICNFKWDRNFCKPTLDAQHQPITVAQPVATRFAFVWMIYSTISIAANKRIQIKINIISFSRHTVPTRLPHIFYSFTLWTKLILE